MVDKKSREAFILETIPIKATDIPYRSFPPESVILIDEISLVYSNRDFADKQKKEQLKKLFEFLQLQRRNKLIVEAFSVTFEGADKRIRDLCDDMYLVDRWARVFVFAKHLIRKPIVVHPSADAPATIQDDILSDPVVFYPFGGIKSAFIPYWAKFYHSFLTDGENVKDVSST